MDIEDHPIVICAEIGRHDIHQMRKHLAFRTNPPKSILGKTSIPSYGMDELFSGGNLSNEGKKAICEVLKSNLDVFPWKPADMTRVPKHLLNISVGIKSFLMLFGITTVLIDVNAA
ncbi:hypothetical protein Tco_1068741 [Tanacetum coccineum]|uniref:Uncharacterized protein n=1 Tax=Tanacetum coccineum TaxID=301880 RepID=A0ABQ5HGR8_9ASTR